MDMTHATILDRNIDDDLWLEVILAMSQIKNVKPIKALEGNNPHKAHFKKSPNINYLQVLGTIIYMFIYKKERTLKLEKFEARALKDIFVGYDGHTIYKVFIWSQDKIVQVKDPWIFEDTSEKAITSLFDFQGKPTFKGFLAIN